MKSYLKTGSVSTETIVDSHTGEVLKEEKKTAKFMTKDTETFMLVWSSFISMLGEEMTHPEVKVFSYLLRNYIKSSEFEIGKATKVAMSVKYKLNVRTIENTVYSLNQKKLIFRNDKNLYMINPRYAFAGTTVERKRQLKLIIELGCKDC